MKHITSANACTLSTICLGICFGSVQVAHAATIPEARPAPGAELSILTGSVSNIATGNLLEGARVSLPQLSLSTLTDEGGRYTFLGIPQGSYDVVVSYTGLDSLRTKAFLPGLLKGLSASMNYTILDTHGNFGGSSYRRTGQVVGFTPRSGNVMLSWRHRKFSTRVLYNYTGDHITSYSATSPALNVYAAPRRTVSLGVAYQVRPSLSLTCDIPNLFNEPQVRYVFKPDRVQRNTINFVTVTVGVSGQF